MDKYIKVSTILPEGTSTKYVSTWIRNNQAFIEALGENAKREIGDNILFTQPLAIRFAMDLYPEFAVEIIKLIDITSLDNPKSLVEALQQYVSTTPVTEFDKAMFKILQAPTLKK